MKQISLIAFYGRKDKILSDFIAAINNRIAQYLGTAFQPYSVDQIHATIIGLEGTWQTGEVYNQNFFANYGIECVMQIQKTLQFINNTDLLPVNVNFAGYDRNTDYGFSSFHQHPYDRSFNIQGDKVNIIGWPRSTTAHKSPMADLRRSFEKFGILHKWHRSPKDSDNDCYLVLGLIRPETHATEVVARAMLAMRDYLSRMEPLTLSLSKEDLSLVSYTDVTLPNATTTRLGIPDAIKDPDRLVHLLGDSCLPVNEHLP